jgi:HKD family nuclease
MFCGLSRKARKSKNSKILITKVITSRILNVTHTETLLNHIYNSIVTIRIIPAKSHNIHKKSDVLRHMQPSAI